MILSLVITLVVGLFLGQTPALTDAHCLSTRQGSVDYQAMKSAPLGRRNFCDFHQKSSQDEYAKKGGYERKGQYDESGGYYARKGDYHGNIGKEYGVEKSDYNAGKQGYYNSGNSGSNYASSKTKSYASHHEDTSGYKGSYESSSKKDNYKSYDLDLKNSGGYNSVKNDKTDYTVGKAYGGYDKVSKDDGKYMSSKVEKSDGSYNKDEVPSHVDHEPLSVPKGAPKGGYEGGSKDGSYGGKKVEESSYSDGKVKISGEGSYSSGQQYSETDGNHFKKDKDNYA